MKIHYLSDLHLRAEGDQYVVAKTDADVVALAGDIATGSEGIVWAANQAKQLQTAFIYVPGNHEFYGGEFCHTLARQRAVAAELRPWVHFLEREAVVIGGVRFLGATLWSDFNGVRPEQRLLAQRLARERTRDFSLIRMQPSRCGNHGRSLAEDATGVPTERTPYDARLLNLSTDDVRSLFGESVSFLRRELERPFDGKTVVVTHFGPHPKAQHPEYPAGILSPYFWSDLSGLVERADVWVFGHSHGNVPEFNVGKCRVVCNMRGNEGEAVNGFDPLKTIEV